MAKKIAITGGIGSGGVFAHSAQVQTNAGAFQHNGNHNGDGNSGISQKAIGQKDVPKPAEFIGKGQGAFEKAAGGSERDGRNITIYQLDQGAAEKVTDAHTEGGHGKAGHVLVGA